MRSKKTSRPAPKHNRRRVPAAHQPKPTRWQVDYDYLEKLSDEEASWLDRFTDAHYNAYFTDALDYDDDDRRDANNRKNAARRDLYSTSELDGRATFDADEFGFDSTESRDLSPTPEYLDSVEYREARAALRELIPTDERKTTKPSAELDEAKRKIRRSQK